MIYLLEDRTVILITPDENFCYGTQGFNQQAFVVLCHCLVLVQNGIEIPEKKNEKNYALVVCVASSAYLSKFHEVTLQLEVKVARNFWVTKYRCDHISLGFDKSRSPCLSFMG